MYGMRFAAPWRSIAAEGAAEEIPAKDSQQRNCRWVDLFGRPRRDGERLNNFMAEFEAHRPQVPALLCQMRGYPVGAKGPARLTMNQMQSGTRHDRRSFSEVGRTC